LTQIDEELVKGQDILNLIKGKEKIGVFGLVYGKKNIISFI